MCQKTNTQGRPVSHIDIPGLHTSLVVFGRQDCFLISLRQDLPVEDPVRLQPFLILCRTRDSQTENNIRMFTAKMDRLQSRKRIKTTGTAAVKPAVSQFIGMLNLLEDSLLQD